MATETGRGVLRAGDALPVVPNTAGNLAISPTDVAQFIRLDQCRRYLRLSLHQRSANRKFLDEYGVAPQSIPPLLTRSGAEFEQRVERTVAEHFPVTNLAAERKRQVGWTDDNARMVEEAATLPPGQVQMLFQPRLQVALDGWHIRGDVDILRLERDADGTLRALIADMKSSTSAKVEHRLQVAFYHAMLTQLLADASVPHAEIDLAILYRGPADGTGRDEQPEEAVRRQTERDAAIALFGVGDAYLERVAERDAYLGAVRDLVTGPGSVARRAATTPFDDIPFHLTYKCDGCLFNEYCLKRSAERDDLSLIPHLTEQDKGALTRAGVGTTRQLAALKEFRDDESPDLFPAAGQESLIRQLSATWPVGPRLDELIHRAKRYRRYAKDPGRALTYIPSKGYGSLPYADADQNPNLVRVFLDAQHDYLQDRLYLLGARVVACEWGEPVRERSVVRIAAGPPDSAEIEEALLVDWIAETIRAVVDLATPDEAGQPRAPIHLIFWDKFGQETLLEGLARHFATVLGATPLYDFATQLAAFDSPLATFLDREIRELRNYPMVAQSLQAVAAYVGFDWNAPEPFRDTFRARLFDARTKLDRDDDESPWITGRARFNSQIPLEYAYAAWENLSDPDEADETVRDDYRYYRAATSELLVGFQARRLEALEHIAAQFKGNRQTTKTAFMLPDLSTWEGKARSLAEALDEFVLLERHAELGEWKAARLAPPERRVLAGDTLIVRYEEGDQDPETVAWNRENERLRQLRAEYESAYLAANPGATKAKLTKVQTAETKWSLKGMRVWLRLDLAETECDLEEALALSTIRPGAMLAIAPRWATDSRQPVEDRVTFTPTPKQLLHRATHGSLVEIAVERDGDQRAVSAKALVELREMHGGAWSRGFVFGGVARPLLAGERYTLDESPDSYYGYWCAKVAEGLRAGGRNTLYARLTDPMAGRVNWSETAVAGQARFLAGLDALREADLLHGFEPGKRDYIGGHGSDPILLVQGPPGTGKSYSTAFAIFARLQGALAAGRDYRIFLSCKTHAATDVLLDNVARVQQQLRDLFAAHPALCGRYFDRRLLDLPLFRVRPRETPPAGVTALWGKNDPECRPGQPPMADAILAERWCVIASPPGRTYNVIKERWDNLFGHDLGDCLVLDEASQMNLPEAMLAALPLKPDGHLIVVGDPRQMPPIVKHVWDGEPRRTFKEFRAYESLFLWLQALRPPYIKFEESFRLHADMAEFLRRAIYQQDGIAYHSKRRDTLPPRTYADPFIAGVLTPEHPLVVVVHDEDRSQVRNPYERELIAPVLEALADLEAHALDPAEGLGVVVPHRAQRADVQVRVPALVLVDPATGAVARSAVDTVERFQGDEREAILVSATESDPAYLLATGDFLLDPRRLTVALSRAKKKMVLVAARSVFELFSADEETFAHAQLWKGLLRRTCTVPLWQGERGGHRVEVWGNAPGVTPTPRAEG